MTFLDLLTELSTAFALPPATSAALSCYPLVIDGMALQLCAAASNVEIVATIETPPRLLHEQPQLTDRLLGINHRLQQGNDHPLLSLGGEHGIVLSRRVPFDGLSFATFKQDLEHFANLLEHCHRLVAEATPPPPQPMAMAALLRV